MILLFDLLDLRDGHPNPNLTSQVGARYQILRVGMLVGK